jgi:two-component system chemotaxis response regulator CheY
LADEHTGVTLGHTCEWEEASPRFSNCISGEPLDILVIDDSAFIRALVRISLQATGYEVEAVEPTSWYELLNALHELRPALIITDLEMPYCSGETLIRSIREDPVLKDMAILVMSSHREEALVARLSQWDLAGYLVKPIKPDELVALVRRALPLPPGQTGASMAAE